MTALMQVAHHQRRSIRAAKTLVVIDRVALVLTRIEPSLIGRMPFPFGHLDRGHRSQTERFAR